MKNINNVLAAHSVINTTLEVLQDDRILKV